VRELRLIQLMHQLANLFGTHRHAAQHAHLERHTQKDRPQSLLDGHDTLLAFDTNTASSR
jgi:hypothetical protein